MLLVAGNSGSGKSTLARALVGLVPHFHGGEMSGRVTVCGQDTRGTPPRALAGVCGFVSQDPESQAVVDRVEDEIAFTMENLGLDPTLMRKRMEETLDALGLAPLRERALATLSGGERQRVAIAAVLAAQPRALVLDEPTSQLDPQSAEEVIGVLARLNADLGLTVVLVEHRLERVVQIADRMFVLGGDGGLLAGPVRDVLERSPVAPPLAVLARALGWRPLPLTIREGRAFAAPLRSSLRPRANGHPVPGEELVRAEGLRVALGGREVLRGIDLSVAAGETVAIVGRNGSGKTTLLRSLVGLVRPLAGRAIIAGSDTARVAVELTARAAGYLPQDPGSLLFKESVRDEIAFTIAGRGLRARPEEVLAEHGIEAFAGRDPRDLSAGERLRVALAAATAGTRVWLLDEPTRGIDYAGKGRLAADLARRRAEGKAVLLVTHDVELIAQCATRVVLLAEGTVVLDGPVREVLGESALFSSQMNKIWGDRRILTPSDALAALEPGALIGGVQ
ncbi:MAG: ATP-binding cassette domain-containing protein [Acidobacteria bacterium]|nr:ATP-binding cassette domain-containing protein [Acidobacteriota bacterium]